MDTSIRLNLNRDEDQLVKATLIVNGAEINDVSCKIYLPERINEKPHLVFKPSRGDAARIMSAHKAGFKAVVYGFDKEIQTIFETPEVHFTGAFTKNWGDDLSETTLPGKPQNLIVTHPLRGHEESQKTHVVFGVTTENGKNRTLRIWDRSQ
jgi:hypothetical protein